jgi:beta-glucanase (GH16 family)
MINLINSELWQLGDLPWGNSPSSGTVVNYQPQCVGWFPDRLLFMVEKKDNEGWFMDKDWNRQVRQRHYQAGWIISKERFHYGYYEMECKLPNFLNSFPAWWLISTKGAPPEFDIMEQFRKDKKDSRHKVSSTYHYGSNYTTDHYQVGGTVRKCLPLDRTAHIFRLLWLPDRMVTTMDGKEILRLEDIYAMPKKPMNMIVNSGLGDWNPTTDSEFKPFIVTKLTFEPL